MPAGPALSILVPSFNAGEFIQEAIETVVAQLGDNDEVVIQDGKSTDGSIEKIRANFSHDPRVKIVTEEDQGQTDALRMALARAENRYVGWLNADDFYYPGALDAVRAVLAEKPDTDVVYGRYTLFDKAGKEFRTLTPAEFTLDSFIRKGCHVFSGATFMSVASIDAAGGFDPSFEYCMDYDLFSRMASAGVTAQYIPDILGGLRWHDASKSGSQEDQFLVEGRRIRLRYAHGLIARAGVHVHVLRYIVQTKTIRLRHSSHYSRLRGTKHYADRRA